MFKLSFNSQVKHLSPKKVDSAPVLPHPPPVAKQNGNLLEGTYDEAASAKSFQEALAEWRGENTDTPKGNLLEGTYDEAGSAKSFQEALAEWRGENSTNIHTVKGRSMKINDDHNNNSYLSI